MECILKETGNKKSEVFNEENYKVSIIMAAFNAQKTIGESIQSVMKQSYDNWELIIVDDCSSDNTYRIALEFAHKDSRIRVHKNELNKGVSYTRKRALSLTGGNWIAILDSDDLWKRDKLEKQISVVKNDSDILLVYTGSSFIDDNNKEINWVLRVPTTISYGQLLKQNLISNSSVLIKKAIYQEYYASGDEMHEDFATWLLILKNGVKAYGIDEPLLIYRISGNSKSGNKKKSALMNWNTYRYIGLNSVPSLYYMCCYAIRGFIKYSQIERARR